MRELLPALVGIVLAGLDGLWWRRIVRRPGRLVVRLLNGLLAGLLLIVAAASIIGGGFWYWYYHRPQPDDTAAALFQGITYVRDVRQEPRPVVIHVVKVDLDAPGIHVLVTPGETPGNREVKAQTTSAFLADYGLQVAINGDFFNPFYAPVPWYYYPHTGDPIGINGFSASMGTVYAPAEPWTPYAPVFISADNRVQFNGRSPLDEIYNVISGDVLFLWKGQDLTGQLTARYHLRPQPRTVIALDRTGRTLLLFVIDGRQPNYSEGVTMRELAGIVQEYGGYSAVNMDGGGSATVVVEGEDGKPAVLNSPIHTYVPGRERPIANHLGVYALPLDN
jgi:hypothetical protein